VGIANGIYTSVGIIGSFTYPIWAKLFKKALIPVSFGMGVLALFCMMTLTTNLAGVYLAALFIAWGGNMMNPYIMAFIMRITPPRLVPTGISFLSIGVNVGFSLGIIGLNFLAGFLGGGMKNVLLICTVGMAICGVVAPFVYRTKDAGARLAEPRSA
jgi:MFS family permease